MKQQTNFIILLLLLVCADVWAQQPFILGHDLSYVNQMEDCGAVYKEGGLPKDPYQIFADHGTNLVRVRLWVDPHTWQAEISQPDGVKKTYNDLADVIVSLKRAKAKGMQTMLGLHYSDTWCDPAKQIIPQRWESIAYDTKVLADTTYQYTYNLLLQLAQLDLMPEYVKVGNESNRGMMSQLGDGTGLYPGKTISTDWSRHAQLFNAGIKAVRDAGNATQTNPKITLHFAGDLNSMKWNYENIINHGVTDFDVLGFSYYYAWNGGSIHALEETVTQLKTTFPQYEVMVVETGYNWTEENFDGLGNIISTYDPAYAPVSPQKQLEYMIDFAKAVKNGGGAGVVFWEPAWVITPCNTPWGTGTSHDDVVFFDPVNTNFMEGGGGHWTEPQWYLEHTQKVVFTVNMSKEQGYSKVFVNGDMTDHKSMEMLSIGNGLFTYTTYLPTGSKGQYYFSKSDNNTEREIIPTSCATEGKRTYTIHEQGNDFAYKWGSCAAAISPNCQVTFQANTTGVDTSKGIFITGHFTGNPWKIVPMEKVSDHSYQYTVEIPKGFSGAFHLLNDQDENAKEIVPEACADWWKTSRGYSIGSQEEEKTYQVAWASCGKDPILTVDDQKQPFHYRIYPNPIAQGGFYISTTKAGFSTDHLNFQLYDLRGKEIAIKAIHHPSQSIQILLQDQIPKGVYLLTIQNKKGSTISNCKIIY